MIGITQCIERLKGLESDKMMLLGTLNTLHINDPVNTLDYMHGVFMGLIEGTVK